MCLYFAVAGVSSGKLVEAHGSFSTASCINCKTKQDPEQVKVRMYLPLMTWLHSNIIYNSTV